MGREQNSNCFCSCRRCCCRDRNFGTVHAMEQNGVAHELKEEEKPFSIACEWDKKQTQQFSDDGTNTFFWRAHTVTVLLLMICVLVYVASFEKPSENSEYNTKRGIAACVMVFLLFGVTQIRDGPFKRPHPALWRLVLCLSVLYELALIFIFFQNVDDARQLMSYVDGNLGKPLPEVSYGDDCSLYNPDHPKGAWHSMQEKMDCFVPAHLIGWWAKTLILRDYWMCTIISFLFEVMEYTLEHQLPNFNECWWDHWLMDFILCNGVGIWLGMKTCNYLAIKPYHWRGLWNIPTYGGKLKRLAEQFTPYSWKAYDWNATASLKRWLAVCGIIIVFTLAELNFFYLKYILWIPPPHFVNLVRVTLFLFSGAVALNETFAYMDDENCKRFGQQAWVMAAIIATEVLICVKFAWPLLTKPLPLHVAIFWSVFLIVFLGYTVWKFWPSIVSGFASKDHALSQKTNSKRVKQTKTS